MKSYFGSKNLRKLLSAAAFTVVVASGTVDAQNRYYQDQRYTQQQYVSIYEDCDFRGERRDIAIGDFRSMRELDFGNDRLSSIKVPNGLEVVLYEHDNFRGKYARVDRDIQCLNGEWNDQASSLRVEASSKGYGQNRDDYRNDRPVYGGREDQHRRPTSPNDGVTAGNVTMVVYNNKVLEQVNERLWQTQHRRFGTTFYNELRRDTSNVYLENQHTRERIRIDLFTNEVTTVDMRGEQKRYAISNRESRRVTPSPIRVPDVNPHEPNGRINGECFTFNAYTTGGQGGVRFHGKDNFYRFDKKSAQDQICHNGSLTMEINKTSPNTTVVIEIQGKKFIFAAGEKEDLLKSNWYRKMVSLKVGR